VLAWLVGALTGQGTSMPRVSGDLPHCPAPPAVNRALDPAHWTRADNQPAPLPDDTATALAVLSAPGSWGREETYVRVAHDVERLDPVTWVTVAALWTVPARRGLLIVPAGLVALYEPEIDRGFPPREFAEGQAWLPECQRCAEPLFDSGSVPGMYYPQPDLGPDESPWCPQHPDTDRPRPHAVAWRLVQQ
jgi:hypothetical protein